MSSDDLIMISFLGTLLCSLVTFLLAILQVIPAGEDNKTACIVLASILQFLFLSTMCWISALAFKTTRLVYSITLVKKSRKGYWFYALYAFGLPLLFTLLTFGISWIDGIKVYRDPPACFLADMSILVGLFLAPIYLSVLANLVLCFASISRIMKTTNLRTSDADRMKRNILAALKLSVLLGAGWVLLFLGFIHPNLWILFQVYFEAQGILITAANFTSWSCVRKLWHRQENKVLKPCRCAASQTAQSAAVNSNNNVETVF